MDAESQKQEKETNGDRKDMMEEEKKDPELAVEYEGKSGGKADTVEEKDAMEVEGTTRSNLRRRIGFARQRPPRRFFHHPLHLLLFHHRLLLLLFRFLVRVTSVMCAMDRSVSFSIAFFFPV